MTVQRLPSGTPHFLRASTKRGLAVSATNSTAMCTGSFARARAATTWPRCSTPPPSFPRANPCSANCAPASRKPSTAGPTQSERVAPASTSPERQRRTSVRPTRWRHDKVSEPMLVLGERSYPLCLLDTNVVSELVKDDTGTLMRHFLEVFRLRDLRAAAPSRKCTFDQSGGIEREDGWLLCSHPSASGGGPFSPPGASIPRGCRGRGCRLQWCRERRERL